MFIQMNQEAHKSTMVVYLDGCDFIEVLGIRNTKASHPMLVAPLLEMALISPSPPITVVATYLALEFLMTNCSKH
jgi:hypothetical protein